MNARQLLSLIRILIRFARCPECTKGRLVLQLTCCNGCCVGYEGKDVNEILLKAEKRQHSHG
jgi:hypothetical protein